MSQMIPHGAMLAVFMDREDWRALIAREDDRALTITTATLEDYLEWLD
jgi:hypothetical protein